ncbi:MAG: hypothetical protein AB4080_26695 [Trichodesmium sp.]
MKTKYKNTQINKNQKVNQKSPHPFLLALILTGILAAETYPNLTETAIAAVKVLHSSQLESKGKINSKADKFAEIIKNAAKTQVESEKEIYGPSLLGNKSIAQILGVSQNYINYNLDDLQKLSKTTTQNGEKLAEQMEEIPDNIVDAVRQDLGGKISISPEDIKVVKVSQETWPNTCLGLAKTDELCGQRLVEGWRIFLSNGNDIWIYRTDNRGNLMRIESTNQRSSDSSLNNMKIVGENGD